MNKNFNRIIDYCSEHSIPLTEQQTLVLNIVCSCSTPITAHAILDELKKINPKANRMTIHRSLEYLTRVGVIHKLSFNHTYIPCSQLENRSCQLLVCLECGKKIEFHSAKIMQVISQSSKEHDFVIVNPIEVMGYCKGCAGKQ